MLKRIVGFTLLAGFGLAVLMVGPVAAQKAPADFAFEQHKDSPGAVTFSHEKHKAAGAEKCNACHTKVFKMKKGADTLAMEKMKAGEQCGACHNGKTEMGGKTVYSVSDKANCEKCHKKS